MKTSKVDVCVSALLTVSEEVRSRCSLKHRKSLLLSEVTMENFPMDTFTVFETEPGCRWELFFSCFLSTIYLSFQPHCIVFLMTFLFCWFSHSLKCQATAWKPALGFSKSVRAQPCTSILCHGADQPSPTQIHERGHGPAFASQCKETTGYEWSVASFFKSVFWTWSSFLEFFYVYSRH